MTIEELGTIMQYGIDVKIIILNNNFLGMVKQWQDLFFDHRYSETPMLNPDFTGVAAAYGIAGERVATREELDSAIRRMLDHRGAYLLDVQIDPDCMVFPMTPAGSCVTHIMLNATENIKTDMTQQTLYTVTVYSENQVGLLNQISIIFTRRQLNIESLSVSGSAIEGVHKFTITTYSDRETMEKLVKQIEKRIDVLRAFFYTDDEIIFQEVALYKVPTDKLLDDRSIEDLIRKHNARILEVNRTYTVIEKSGHPDETQSLFEELSRYDVMQFVRSGRVAITKSTVEHVSIFLQEQQYRQNQL